MFRYQDNKKVSNPREAQKKVVTHFRTVEYINNHPNPKVTEPIISYGFEPVREEVVSPDYDGLPTTLKSAKTVDGRRDHQIKEDYRPKKTMNPDKQKEENKF